MNLIRNECETGGLGDQFHRIMEYLQAQRGIAPGNVQEPVTYKAPPPVSITSNAETQPALLQCLTHANHPLPSTPYNAPPARSPAAQTHQEQLTQQQMAQIRQCSFTGQPITDPSVMNHQAHLIPMVSTVGAAKAGPPPPPHR